MRAGAIRRFFERRWAPQQRAANFCSLLGGFIGFITFGLAHIALFFFPIVMALAMSTVARWNWMPPVKEGKPRRGLGFLIVAPPVCLLLSYPIILLLLIPLSVIMLPIVLLYHSGRGTDDASFDLAAIAAFLAVLAGYFWLLGRSLRRFTGAWHRGLFVRMVAWICGLIAIGTLLASQINAFGSAPLYSANSLWLFLLWVLSTLALSQAGAIIGLWLSRPQ